MNESLLLLSTQHATPHCNRKMRSCAGIVLLLTKLALPAQLSNHPECSAHNIAVQSNKTASVCEKRGALHIECWAHPLKSAKCHIHDISKQGNGAHLVKALPQPAEETHLGPTRLSRARVQ